MQIIGVTGFRRSGKNSVTRILAERFGFKQYAFADALRAMCAAVDPFIILRGSPAAILERLGATRDDYRTYNVLVDQLGYELAKDVPDFRRFLQRLGTEGIRGTFGPNAWVDALARKVTIDNEDRVTISDVRFRSEADWIHSRGGIIWRVVRPGVGGDDAHASEVEIPHLPTDRVLQNDKALPDLERAIVEAYQVDAQTLPR